MFADKDGYIRLNSVAYAEQPLADIAIRTQAERNALVLERELAWFSRVLETRLALYFCNECEYTSIAEIEPPDITYCSSSYGDVVREFGMGSRERLLFMLALAPHLRPQALNLLLIRDPQIDRPYSEFGGWRGKVHGGFLPTGETAAFLIAGDKLGERLDVIAMLEKDHYFTRCGLLRVHSAEFDEAYLSAAISVSNEYFHKVTTGVCEKPDFSIHFPATHLTTNLSWDDLVLAERTLDDIEHMRTWLLHQKHIMQNLGLEKSIKPGYRALFYGPPGTGKTLTACLLGKAMTADVYRVDLAAVVSKYIGETEKNLEAIFTQAENRNWILFFDEADALFGKRTETSNSNDRHSNQEVAYLLQRIECFPGVVVLATNLRGNIDDAFFRRFQSAIYFPMPDFNQRLALWENAFINADCLDASVDLKLLAKEYEIAGGSIVNVVRYAAIRMVKRGNGRLTTEDLEEGVAKEIKKQGRVLA